MSNIRDSEGELMLSSDAIEKIVSNSVYNEDGIERAMNLANMRGADGKSLLTEKTIVDFSQLQFNKNLYDRLMSLSEFKDKNGNCVFNKNSIDKFSALNDEDFNKIIQFLKKHNVDHPVSDFSASKLGDDISTISLSTTFDVQETGTMVVQEHRLYADGTDEKTREEYYMDGSAKSLNIGAPNSFVDKMEVLYRNEKGEYVDASSIRKDKNGNLFDVNNNRVQREFELESQLEDICDETTQQPIAIISTKKSSVLPGAYEKTMYTYSDYDESYDIEKGIQDGTIQGGTPLAQVTENPDGTITFNENINSNGCNIQRNYTKGTNGIDYEYSYQITDTTGKKILDNKISFVQNSPCQTTTQINGKTYIANFDEETKLITIESPDGVETINFNDISENNEQMWNVVKNLPANQISTLKSTYWTECVDIKSSITSPSKYECINENTIKSLLVSGEYIKQTYLEDPKVFIFRKEGVKGYMSVKYNEENNSLKCDNGIEIPLNGISVDDIKTLPLFDIISFVKGGQDPQMVGEYLSHNLNGDKFHLQTGQNVNMIAHELGHLRDKQLDLSEDKNLIDLYNKEFEKFNSKYTDLAGQQYVEYFSEFSASNGISELIAETHTILNNFGHNNACRTRAQLLVQNFPETVSYIASKFGLNEA